MRQSRNRIAIMLALTLFLALLSGLSYEPVNAAKKVSTPKISVSAISDGTGIKVTIKKTKNAEGYTIYLKGPQDKEYVAVTTLKKNGKAKRKYNIKNLSGGEYNVKVKAYLKSGSKTVWSKESKVSKITVNGKNSGGRAVLPADVEEYVNNNYPYLLSLYDQGLVSFSAEYETKDYITFGGFDMEYYDDDYEYVSAGKKENMVWEVLEYSPDKKTALVLSRDIIKSISHDPSDPEDDKNVTWEESSIRTWLNNKFYKNAFSKEEKILINKVMVDNSSISDGGKDTEDKIFLISPSEVQKYFPDDNEDGCSLDRVGYFYNGKSVRWALRSPAPGNVNNLSFVTEDGEIESSSEGEFYTLGIRPACRITLTDDMINKNNLSIGKNYKKVIKNVYVTIGSCEEDGKKSALEWVVLDHDEEKGSALLISKNILSNHCFDDGKYWPEWYSCKLRAFMNGEFIRETFTAEERALILQTSLKNPGSEKTVDSIFALSFDELYKYDKGKNLVSTYKNGASGLWWLREVDDEEGDCSAVASGGNVYYPSETADYVGIRPVMNINLKFDKNAPISRLDTPTYEVEAFRQEKKIIISINKNLNSDGYYIYSKKHSDKDFSEIADVKQGDSDTSEYTLSDLEAGEYIFRVIAYKKNGSDTLKSEYEEKEIRLEDPVGIMAYKTEKAEVDASDYVKENYPALYNLYEDGKIGLAGEGKRDTIVLGSYELEYALRGENGYPKTEKMPLEWEVLEYSADGTKALVISKYIICHRYFDGSELIWETSNLRKWLNSDFYKKAFNKKEQAAIRLSYIRHEDMFLNGNDTSDRIFLLSVNDVEKYFPDNDYLRLGVCVDNTLEYWWLREDNRSKNEYSSWDSIDWDEEYWPNAHPTVADDGSIDVDGCDVSYDFIGVRPAFWIDLTDEIIQENNLSILMDTEPEVEKAYVVLGSYGSEGKAIEWEILDYDEKNNKVLLMSRYIIDTLKYNSSTKKNAWADSSLRKYLNGDFIKKSFSESEQALISQVSLKNETMQGNKEKTTKDKVYILSLAEFLRYYPVKGYDVEKPNDEINYYNWISLDMDNKCDEIWLRTQDEKSKDILYVDCCGAISEERKKADKLGGIRPVLWLNLK